MTTPPAPDPAATTPAVDHDPASSEPAPPAFDPAAAAANMQAALDGIRKSVYATASCVVLLTVIVIIGLLVLWYQTANPY